MDASAGLSVHDLDSFDEIEASFTAVQQVLARWAEGQNSWWIGKAVRLPEADVCRIISADRERRHKARPRP